MAKKTTHPLMTPDRIAQSEELATKIEREDMADIIAQGKAAFARHKGVLRLIAMLKEERLKRGLTLDEVGNRTGIGKANLSRLENNAEANPTWETLASYAESVGKHLEATLV